ncbi:1-deoxy-D-xylulose-5-phosphate reductoisomerase [Sphingomonas abietis]|uniref:1-deoxy-D-xylulose 5-phosphate reductoisomerase n=1 Tax=Sphingomonas abietis TaxID=3012344 RepID=A0ABY7NUF6_9SPHN|nr:1-deoxy-D-xylulose-5-phosphate reductoisomerase [Sphingomonas abietis]WBO24187.1 1-deoxy-D-xylulose-5-phosphate reductoisomerase [Sphingomonas abietis]
MRSITILGATGSVGTSTLDLVEREPDRFAVEALTAYSNVEGLAAAARRTRAKIAVIGDAARYQALKEALAGSDVEVAAGAPAIIEAAARGADWTMAAIVGLAGLEPVMAALGQGKALALANKESLVSAGSIMIRAAESSGARLLPVDSEHNAVFQCYEPEPGRVSRIILTASGGPFRTWTSEQMRAVTPAQAVKHPNWSMGAKISVDSATMMNKGLELIEAHHLFPVGADRLEVLVHPQSVVHSMVEYIDGSVLAQLGSPDMRVPIAHALAWPDRMATPCQRLDLAAVGKLEFEAPDFDRFPALALAKAALAAGGARPAVLNAANETAVAAFLAGEIGFLDIAAIVAEVLAQYEPLAPQTLSDVVAIDVEARHKAASVMRRMAA